MPNGPLGKTWLSVALLFGLPVVGLVAIALMFLGLVDRKSDSAIIDLRVIANATQLYERQLHHAPGSLEALVEAGDLEKLPLDPWGRPYLLEPADGGVRLSTLGREGSAGGTGVDADLDVFVPSDR